MKQRPPNGDPRAMDTIDTSDNETNARQPRRRVRSQRTRRGEKSVGADELGHFFMTGPTKVAGKPSHFNCRVGRKDVCVLTHRPEEVLQHLRGAKLFRRDQQLNFDTPSRRVLVSGGELLCNEEIERRRDRIMRPPLVVRHGE